MAKEGSKHPEFLGAGANPGIEVWRIENKVPVRQPKESYGKFCKGDSYLVLKTTISSGGAYEWDLHFWLGEESSVDEIGIAAYKTVELDDSLGGAPVQYRETQGNESSKFQAIFKQGITYLDGGVDSGFKKVERDKYDTRLLHCKGKRTVRVNQVAVSHSSLNSGDVFILDAGLKLYQWNGKDSNKYEKAKALDVVQAIKDDERGGRAEIVRVEDGSETDEFWAALGGKGAVMSAEKAGGDEAFEIKAAADVKLVAVSVQGGAQTSHPVPIFAAPQQPIKHAMLGSSGVYLVSTGTEVYAWVGKGAEKSAKSAAMGAASAYITAQGMSNKTPLARISEGAETPIFKDLFSDWPKAAAKAMNFSSPVKSPTSKIAGTRRQSSSSELADAMIHSPSVMSAEEKRRKMEAELNAFTDKVGKVEVWRIANFGMHSVDEDKYGQFYSGDSYIILHSYESKSGKAEWVIYFWLGRQSSTDEIGTAALKAKELDDKYGGAPVQVRVTQNKEPLHLLRLFQGRFVVHEGGNPSSFKNKPAESEKVSDGTGLYHIRGSNEYDTRAVQVEKSAASLNSSDAFVLCSQNKVLIWYGKHSSQDEKETAAKIAENLLNGRPMSAVEEGGEPADFWAELGGKKDYPEGADLEDTEHPPRLFHCSNASGAFETEELQDFSQDDLQMDDVYILDVYRELFAWVGNDANETERRGVMELSSTYLKSAQREGTPVTQVSAGNEPPNFTCHFLGWDHTKAKVFEDPYEAKMKALKAKSGADRHSGDRHSGDRHSGDISSPAASPFGATLKKTPGGGDSVTGGSPEASSRGVSPFATALKKTPNSTSILREGSPAGKDGGGSDGASPFAIKLRSTGESKAAAEIKLAAAASPAAPAAAAAAAAAVASPAAAASPQTPAAASPGPAVLRSPADFRDPNVTKFSYLELKNREECIECQVNPVDRPLYLTDKEMKDVMGCTREEYLAMKLWKQNELRKKVGLF